MDRRHIEKRDRYVVERDRYERRSVSEIIGMRANRRDKEIDKG